MLSINEVLAWRVITIVRCEVCGSPRTANAIAFVTWLSFNFPQADNMITHAEHKCFRILKKNLKY